MRTRFDASLFASQPLEIGSLAHTFAPGDAAGMALPIERARAADRDLAASAAPKAFTWERAIASELADLERLLERMTRPGVNGRS